MKHNVYEDTTAPLEKGHAYPRYLTITVFVAALGGLLFGYDQGVMSGAVTFIGHTFQMSSGLLGFISGCIPLGAMVGCLIAGYLADRIGRKIMMFVSAILFALSGIGCAVAPSVAILIASRLIGGLGIGMVSTLVPLYIAEISPKQVRGKMVGSYQLAVASGIFVVYLVNALIANTHSIAWNQDIGWRMMFLAGIIPGILFFVLLFMIPESPRFLVSKNQEERAKEIMGKVSYDSEQTINNEVKEIKSTVQEEGATGGFLKELLKKGTRMALFIAVMCSVFQQLTGVSAVAYYAPVIFKNAGAGTGAAMIETVLIGLVKVIFVAFFMGMIDKLGRKRLLKWGGYGMAACMLLLAFCFDQTSMAKMFDIFIIALIIIHTSIFEMSWGGGAWVLISEMFPNKIRGRASSIASFALWGATYLVTQLFPVMLDKLGSVWTFVVFGIFCIAMGMFIQFFFNETAGKSLEEIQEDSKK
ncbi:MAG: sugar porter family MFS transporter [Lentilactobacillus buchneri]|jgi:SP family arabinose:H+ symporter-like MFS transporter|nr:sugar porter family MFS transporter [Lentilactobacillus buchneri]MCI1950761.1 sugar porter family MFS transporter [Lentilactobacillus buchneri]MCI2019416.1 sugar porter family MFS transporter [Lentilactobacillus buchneri]MCI2028012.1 sugar porter family MFS transporter [Lentilactobacillus buchneri]